MTVDNELKPVKGREIKKSVDRLKDTSRIEGKAFAQSEYVYEFNDDCIRKKLLDLYVAHRKDLDWDTMVAKYTAIKHEFTKQAELAKRRVDKEACASVDTLTTVTPKTITPARGKWKVKTPVATKMSLKEDSIKDVERVATSTDEHGRVIVHWTLGTMTKYHGLSSSPYEITWDTQPHPLISRKSEEEFKVLVDQYAHCKTYKLLGGYVGNDLLWERTDKQGTRLQYGYVLPFDPPTNKYKVAYRDGICGFKTELDLKNAMKFTESIIQGTHKKYSFGSAATAMQEPLVGRVYVPESQPSEKSSDVTLSDGRDWNELWKNAVPNETQNVTFRADDSPIPMEGSHDNTNRRTSSRRVKPVVATTTHEEDSLKPRMSKLLYQEKRKAENAGSRWKVGKAKVATTSGNNLKYPFLTQTRTGWVAGLLTGFTEGDAKPYVIEWNTKPKQVSHVDDEEMLILRRDFLGSDKRRLLDMLCVGTEVLVPRPIYGQKVGAVMKYGTVMFYDLGVKGFKVLCRDGHEQWVDPQYLDELTAETLEDDSETIRLAAAQAWDPGIMKKVEGYGRYCVRQVGPDGSASVVENVHEPLCVDPALLPREASDSPTIVPAKENEPSGVNDELALWRKGQMLCFLLASEDASKPKKTHGILALNVSNESKCGPCLMANNKFNTFSLQEIEDAAVRMDIPSFAHGCPTTTLQLLLKVSDNDISARDMAIRESEGAWLLSQAPTNDMSARDMAMRESEGAWLLSQAPTKIYTKDEKDLRKRSFPCTFCKEPASGVHQCGYCYCHLHAACAPAFPGTTEGYGQRLVCTSCSTRQEQVLDISATCVEHNQVSFDNHDECENQDKNDETENQKTDETTKQITMENYSITKVVENNNGESNSKDKDVSASVHASSLMDSNPKDTNAKVVGNDIVPETKASNTKDEDVSPRVHEGENQDKNDATDDQKIDETTKLIAMGNDSITNGLEVNNEDTNSKDEDVSARVHASSVEDSNPKDTNAKQVGNGIVPDTMASNTKDEDSNPKDLNGIEVGNERGPVRENNQARDEGSNAQGPISQERATTSLSNPMFPTNNVWNSTTLNSLALKAYGRGGPPPPHPPTTLKIEIGTHFLANYLRTTMC